MTAKKTKAAPRRIGRPPAGARDGEKVRDYPQLSVRVPPEVKDLLDSISIVCRISQWHIVSDGIVHFFRGLSAKERQLVEDLVRRRQSSRR